MGDRGASRTRVFFASLALAVAAAGPAHALVITPTFTSSITNDPNAAVPIVQGALGSIAQNIVALWSAGARTFMVPNEPNLALTPAVLSQPTQAQGAAAGLSALYNAQLEGALESLEKQLPGTKIVRLDVFALLSGVIAAPKAYGFTQTQVPCLTFGVIVGAICDDPRQYVFWDAIHPTAAVHRVLGNAAVGALGF